MGMKNWIKRFRKLPTWGLYLHVSAKSIFSLGLGIVLVSYLPGSGWSIAGWILMAFAVIESLPSTYLIFHHKTTRGKK